VGEDGTPLGVGGGHEQQKGSRMAGEESEQVPYALIVMNAGTDSQPSEVVVVFMSPGEADEFARRHGIDGSVVTPMRFAVAMDGERVPASPWKVAV
jgi:hypothetical protein